MTSDDGDVETVTLAPGESTTVERDRGIYTLTAETADGQDVELAGRAELTVSIGDALQSLTASVEGQNLAVENPNDERVTVDVTGDLDTSFDVPGNWEESQQLGPGTYTATAETTDGEAVQINDEDAFRVHHRIGGAGTNRRHPDAERDGHAGPASDAQRDRHERD